MATCTPTPTLTLFTTVTSTTVITTFSLSVQTLPDTTSTFTTTSCQSTDNGTCASSTVITGTTVISGGVSTISVPVVITSIITESDPISTLFASCSPSPSVPISTTTSQTSQSTSQSSSRPSSVSLFTPTTILVTSTPPPTVITEETSSTLDNGAVTVITLTSTSTPPPSIVLLSTFIAATSHPPASHSQGSKSSSALAPIVGGAVGGFFVLIALVFAIWFILRRCHRSSEDDGDDGGDDIVFPYPVTRDRNRAQHLDLTHEPRPYVYGLVGHSSRDAAGTASRISSSHSRASDGRPDSATALIGPSSGLNSMTMATGAGVVLTSISETQSAEVGRQTSHSSISYLPPGALPTTYLTSSGESGPAASSSRYPVPLVNPPNSSGKAPLVISEEGGQARAEKKTTPDPVAGVSMVLLTDGDRLPDSVHGLAAPESGSKATTQPEEPNIDAPPAYVA